VLDLTTIMPATAYHRRSYAERYSRFTQRTGISRVPTVGLKQDAVGGVFLGAPSALCGSRDGLQGRVRLTCNVLQSIVGRMLFGPYSL
jgi:hypothetical protein